MMMSLVSAVWSFHTSDELRGDEIMVRRMLGSVVIVQMKKNKRRAND